MSKISLFFFLFFILNHNLRKVCEIMVRITFHALVLVKVCQKGARKEEISSLSISSEIRI